MNGRAMRLAALGGALIGMTGCAAVLVGAGAAGGYALSKDAIWNTVRVPKSQAYRVSREVVADNGLIMSEDEANGVIKATVHGANLTVKIKQVTERSVEVKVSARNQLLMPKLDVAQRIFHTIMEQLQPL